MKINDKSSKSYLFVAKTNKKEVDLFKKYIDEQSLEFLNGSYGKTLSDNENFFFICLCLMRSYKKEFFEILNYAIETKKIDFLVNVGISNSSSLNNVSNSYFLELLFGVWNKEEIKNNIKNYDELFIEKYQKELSINNSNVNILKLTEFYKIQSELYKKDKNVNRTGFLPKIGDTSFSKIEHGISKIDYLGEDLDFSKYNSNTYGYDDEQINKYSIKNIIVLSKEFDVITKEAVKESLTCGVFSSVKNIKAFAELFFKKVNSANLKKILEELEEEGFIYIKRTPSLMIKEIVLNADNKLREKIDKNPNFNELLKLEQEGKLKKENNKEYLLYKYNVFPHLKVSLSYNEQNDTTRFSINYFSMKYAKSIMNDLGVWQQFKNSLKEKVIERITGIEDYLNRKIEVDLGSFEYEEGENGEGCFLTKEVVFSSLELKKDKIKNNNLKK